MRTLGFAYRPDPPAGDDVGELARGLVWVGLVAIADPVRADAPAAVAACRRAGIGVKIVTGDTAGTAAEIGRQVGLDPGAALTGAEFAALSDEDAGAAAEKLAILSRARPDDKLRLVRLLMARGQVVAVTGDGVNDGPALNFADVGLAMGKAGTAVAKEASDIVILDDSLASVVTAVKWGRGLYENIQRFLLFQLTINAAALGLAVLGPFLGYELPLTVLQMLWVNLIMDTFAALALATEPPHPGVLRRPPRSPAAFIVTRPMALAIAGGGVAIIGALLVLLVWLGDAGLGQGDAPTRAGTVVFTVFVLLQFWNLFNAKMLGRRGSVFATLGRNPRFLLIAAVILVGQVLIVQFGGTAFRTVPLSLADWLILLGTTSAVLWAGELLRLAGRRPPSPTR
jgi:Ca2+-transporting ATPase